MKKGKLFLLLTPAIFSLVVLACSPAQPTTVKTAPAPIVENKGPAADTKQPWEREWDAILRTARREEIVTVVSGVGGNVRPLITEGFQKRYGIRVDFITGRGEELTQKIFTERKAGLYLQDVALFGATTTINILKPANIIDPIEPVLALPEVLDKKAWLGGDLQFVDKDHLFLAYVFAVNVPIFINDDMVNKQEIRSYKDLLNPKWKGKMVINDPTVTGSGNNWFGVVGEKIMGWDYMRELAKQELFPVRDQRLQVEWLVRGRYPVSITAKTDTVEEFRKAGASITGILPVEGNYTTVGGGTVALIKNAPHPAAARVFINWLLTNEGQTLYSRGYGSPSRRLDVPIEGDPMKIPQPGMKYFNSEEEDLILARPGHMKLAQEIFGNLLK